MIPVERTLRDGTTIRIRDLRPGDADALVDGYAHLSPESRYRRFLGGIGDLSPEAVRYLTNVDGVNHVAIVATRDRDGKEEGIGVARFVRLRDPTVAEPAITVADEMQGRGVGGALAAVLAQLAVARGVEHLRGDVLADNAPSCALLRQMGAELAPVGEGRFAFDVALLRRRHDQASGTRREVT